MTNFLSKSPDRDLQKIHFDIQLILTEQRAQRVDLARVIQLIRKCIQEQPGFIKPGEEYSEAGLEDDISGSTPSGT